MEKTLALPSGPWSRYERSLTVPSLCTAEKIADFFGVSLDELEDRNVDKSHITVLRFKQPEERLGSEELSKAWLIGKKVWGLLSFANVSKRQEYSQIIDGIANLLQGIESRRHEQLRRKQLRQEDRQVLD